MHSSNLGELERKVKCENLQESTHSGSYSTDFEGLGNPLIQSGVNWKEKVKCENLTTSLEYTLGPN